MLHLRPVVLPEHIPGFHVQEKAFGVQAAFTESTGATPRTDYAFHTKFTAVKARIARLIDASGIEKRESELRKKTY